MTVNSESFRNHHRYWMGVARRHGWRNKVHIIGCVDAHGRLLDSVSYDGLERDILLRDW